MSNFERCTDEQMMGMRQILRTELDDSSFPDPREIVDLLHEVDSEIRRRVIAGVIEMRDDGG